MMYLHSKFMEEKENLRTLRKLSKKIELIGQAIIEIHTQEQETIQYFQWGKELQLKELRVQLKEILTKFLKIT